MEPYKLGEMEQKFADLIWEKEPVSSGELTRLCEKAFRWKRTTTYTMLKRLCLRGIFSNEQGVVRAQMTKEEFLDLMKQENKTYKDYKNTSGLISLAVKVARLFGMEKRQYR